MAVVINVIFFTINVIFVTINVILSSGLSTLLFLGDVYNHDVILENSPHA